MDADIIIYALIALFLGWRLYTQLGNRHESDAPPSSPLSPQSRRDDEDLLALPLTHTPEEVPPNPLSMLNEPAPQSLAGGLYALKKAEPAFDEKAFVKGAKAAFEMIVRAYAANDREALRPLLSPVLFDAFSGGIERRQKAGEREEISLLTVQEAHITAARIEGRFGYVTVEFVSDQIKDLVPESAPPAAPSGKREALRLTDIWTFRREPGSPDPNWVLVETRTA